MSLLKRGKWWWTDFSVDGIRQRKPLKTTNWQEALQCERVEIAAAQKGLSDTRGRPKLLFAAIDSYLEKKKANHSERTVELEGERLSVVKKHFGNVKLTSISADAIADYQQSRQRAGIAGRTINMDVGALRRVLKHCRIWRRLEDRVENLPENQEPKGRALTAPEQKRLWEAARSNPNWAHVYDAAVIGGNTSLRPVELRNLRWQNVDLIAATVTVQRTKNPTSKRVVPLNASAQTAFARILQRAKVLGFTQPEHYCFPACQWHRIDPTRPQKTFLNAWHRLRAAAGLPGLRVHDLRHTLITELLEAGTPDHVVESITGHLSRRMLEHYSHIRLDAKRAALDTLDAHRAEELQKLERQAAASRVQ